MEKFLEVGVADGRPPGIICVVMEPEQSNRKQFNPNAQIINLSCTATSAVGIWCNVFKIISGIYRQATKNLANPDY